MTLSYKQKVIMGVLIALLSVIASTTGVIGTWFIDGSKLVFESVRGDTVTLFGRGIYAHMSDMVALQGAAQDLITLLIAVPALIITAFSLRRPDFKRLILFTGVVGYFAVTYTIYLFMAYYNALFLVYVVLAGLSVNLLIRLLVECLGHSVDPGIIRAPFSKTNAKILMSVAVVMALLWLSSVVPPLADGSLYPGILEHFTTLVVQGIDLALLLPWAFMSGLWLLKGTRAGFVFTHVYLVFLVSLMAALSAKIIAVGMEGGTMLPAIVILPVFMLLALLGIIRFLKYSPTQ